MKTKSIDGKTEQRGADTASALIDAHIAQVGGWRGEMLAGVRELIRQALPDVVEEVKWRKPSNPAGVPVWARDGIQHRAPDEWLQALAPLGTDEDKPFLDIAPWLIAVFYERTGLGPDGERLKRYYPHESTGIACGLLIAALHRAGLSTLTHTPSPMAFLNDILGRPRNEMPYLLLVAGHPAADCRVPAITRKTLDEYAHFS